MKMFFYALALMICANQAQAQMRPKVLEIDGEKLSVSESMNLILGRTKKKCSRIDQNENEECRPLIANFRSIKLNDAELTPFKLQHGQAILLRTEEGDGDSKTYQEKLQSNKKTGLSCNVANSISTPPGIIIKRPINLHPGEGIFLWTYDDEFKVNGSSVNFYVCPAN